ncbi:Mu transposase C-terminal domain-containing protein [Streptomyces sp. NPDC005096]|uniref:Mu transposase C-terminal domain-containing protein n=1 Tax=Streptomyces sp. NPDC005096 TaxID=3154559 RepID=UPI0033A520EC
MDPAALRPPAVSGLLALRAAGELTTNDVQEVANTLGRDRRTVWRWLADAEAHNRLGPKPRTRFEITDDHQVLFAYYRGNIARVHEELARRAHDSGQDVISLTALRRAFKRDLTPALRAALREGLPAADNYHPYFQRPAKHRNEIWEGDHKQAPVDVALPGGRLVRPWVTWFVDTGPDNILGYAVTPLSAHRGSVLAALRASLLREAPYGPAGGAPAAVRIDRGADFLSRTVTAAFAVIDVRVRVVKKPHLKGSVERTNRTSVTRFFSDLPRYTKAQRLDHKRRAGDSDPPLTFDGFVTLLDRYVREHNTEYVRKSTGMTRLQAWEADTTPIRDIPADVLHQFMLETDGKGRLVTSKGIELAGRYYIGPCITGRKGDRMRVYWMPHHDETVEVYEFHSNRYLGTCELSDRADRHTIDEVHREREKIEEQARATLKRASAMRRTRFAPFTQPGEPLKELGKTLTRREAEIELNSTRSAPRRSPQGPYQPHTPPADHWVQPRPDSPTEDT